MKWILPLTTTAVSLVGVATGIDISIDSVHCDESLPIYALDNDIQIECGDDEEPRCTFGEQAMVVGTLYYEDAQNRGLINSTAYGTADLSLMSIDYQLFHDLPINFCGEWIQNGHYNYNTCPGNGTYHFEVPYKLPPPKDFTAWFATGWNGQGLLQIYSKPDGGDLLASCTLHMETYTTQSSEEGWKTMPSAATVTFSVLGLIAFLLGCICCMACSRSSRRIVVDDESPLIDQKQPDGAKA